MCSHDDLVEETIVALSVLIIIQSYMQQVIALLQYNRPNTSFAWIYNHTHSNIVTLTTQI